MSSAERFDLVEVGGDAASEKGAAQAAYLGKRVAVVERRKEPGSATVHTGTLPSKTLREAALCVRMRALGDPTRIAMNPRTAGRGVREGQLYLGAVGVLERPSLISRT